MCEKNAYVPRVYRECCRFLKPYVLYDTAFLAFDNHLV